MEGEVVAEGLSFPEGPVWRGSELYFVDVGAGHVLRWTPNAGLRVLADTGGGPNVWSQAATTHSWLPKTAVS
jgi:sugar lactone lactonase YvrE